MSRIPTTPMRSSAMQSHDDSMESNEPTDTVAPSGLPTQAHIANGSGRSAHMMGIAANTNSTDMNVHAGQDYHTSSKATGSNFALGYMGLNSPSETPGAIASPTGMMFTSPNGGMNVASATSQLFTGNDRVYASNIQPPGVIHPNGQLGYHSMVIVPRLIHGKAPKRDNKPRKPRGHQAIDRSVADPTKSFDRESAKYQEPDPSKLEMDFMTEKKDPVTDTWVPSGERVFNRYHHTVNFNSRDDITKLNQWRHQIISRNFPPIAKMRAYWLVYESEQVMAAIRTELEIGTIIRWNKITNAFNDRNHGTIQRAGSELLNPGKRGVTISCDREAPWRTRASIEHAAYKWTEYKELLEAKRSNWSKDSGSDAGFTLRDDSPDEVEIPDPHPEPMTLEQTQSLRKASAKAGREKMKKANQGAEQWQDKPKQTKRKAESSSDGDSTDGEYGEETLRPTKKTKVGTSAPAQGASSALSGTMVQDSPPTMAVSPIGGIGHKEVTYPTAASKRKMFARQPISEFDEEDEETGEAEEEAETETEENKEKDEIMPEWS